MSFACCCQRAQEPLCYSSKKSVGELSVSQDICISLDPTLTMDQQNIHTERLIRWLYHLEFNELSDETIFTLDALGEVLQNRTLRRYADDEDEFAYYNVCRVKPCFVNKKLSIYQVSWDSNHECSPGDKTMGYFFIEKQSNTPLYFIDLFKSTYQDVQELNILLKKYLLKEKINPAIAEKLEKDETSDLSEYLYLLATYSFDEDSMICVFRDNTMDSSHNVIVLKIPIEETKPYLSDTLKELLF